MIDFIGNNMLWIALMINQILTLISIASLSSKLDR